MRILIILFIIFFSFSTQSENIAKCENLFNSYDLEKCLKNYKYMLKNQELEISILNLSGKPYKNGVIFIHVCDKYQPKYKYTNSTGKLTISFSELIIHQCPSLIKINIRTGFGMCPNGKSANTVWDSLKVQEILNLNCF